MLDPTSTRLRSGALLACGLMLCAAAASAQKSRPANAAARAADNPNEKRMGALIDDLAALPAAEVRYFSSLTGDRFLVLDPPREGAPTAGPMEALVRAGAAAIPPLLAHLDDLRPTSLVLSPVSSADGMVLGSAYDPRRPNLKVLTLKTLLNQRAADTESVRSDAEAQVGKPGGGPPRIDFRSPMPKTAPPAPGRAAVKPPDPNDVLSEYTVTVGDLCFVALGQIVNRHYAMLQSPAAGKPLQINSPASNPDLEADVRRDCTGLNQETLWSALCDDLRDGDGARRGEAYKRLVAYYPETVEHLVLAELKRARYQSGPIDEWAKTKLYPTPDAEQWKNVYNTFIRKRTAADAEGVAVRLFEDLQQLVDAENAKPVDQRVSENLRSRSVVKGRVAITRLDRHKMIMGKILPGQRLTDWPHLTSVSHANQALFISTLTYDQSQEVDHAVRDLLNNIDEDDYKGTHGDDDRLAIACMKRLAGRGYRSEIEKYCRRRLSKARPEERAAMQALLAKA